MLSLRLNLGQRGATTFEPIRVAIPIVTAHHTYIVKPYLYAMAAYATNTTPLCPETW